MLKNAITPILPHEKNLESNAFSVGIPLCSLSNRAWQRDSFHRPPIAIHTLRVPAELSRDPRRHVTTKRWQCPVPRRCGNNCCIILHVVARSNLTLITPLSWHMNCTDLSTVLRINGPVILCIIALDSGLHSPIICLFRLSGFLLLDVAPSLLLVLAYQTIYLRTLPPHCRCLHLSVV